MLSLIFSFLLMSILFYFFSCHFTFSLLPLSCSLACPPLLFHSPPPLFSLLSSFPFHVPSPSSPTGSPSKLHMIFVRHVRPEKHSRTAPQPTCVRGVGSQSVSASSCKPWTAPGTWAAFAVRCAKYPSRVSPPVSRRTASFTVARTTYGEQSWFGCSNNDQKEKNN